MTDDQQFQGIPKELLDTVRTEMASHIRIDDAVSAELKRIYNSRIKEINEWREMVRMMERGDRPMSPMQQIQAEAIARLIVLYNVHLLQGRHIPDRFPDGFNKEMPDNSTGKEDWLMDAGKIRLMIESLKEIKVP